ncbi:MAG: hypothetical protein JJE25_05260 [Bacteroidia bacterium]|nr:hypothetical protein [Bacteroidia bacterium]
METSYDYILPMFVVAAVLLFSFSNEVKEFRRKYFVVLVIIQGIASIYFIVRGIQTGDKFYFAFVGIFIAAVLIEYFKRKNNKQDN